MWDSTTLVGAVWDKFTDNHYALPLLNELRWHNPQTARLDDETFMAQVLAAGYCLRSTCPDPPLHCHIEWAKELSMWLR